MSKATETCGSREPVVADCYKSLLSLLDYLDRTDNIISEIVHIIDVDFTHFTKDTIITTEAEKEPQNNLRFGMTTLANMANNKIERINERLNQCVFKLVETRPKGDCE